MINKLQAIDMAMVKALDDCVQKEIFRFIELPEREKFLEDLSRSHRVKMALARHESYNKLGGEKI